MSTNVDEHLFGAQTSTNANGCNTNMLMYVRTIDATLFCSLSSKITIVYRAHGCLGCMLISMSLSDSGGTAGAALEFESLAAFAWK